QESGVRSQESGVRSQESGARQTLVLLRNSWLLIRVPALEWKGKENSRGETWERRFGLPRYTAR
ncbi:hypothetical protein V0288_16490, partial [Pannus brasiliensis CCIBt3594]